MVLSREVDIVNGVHLYLFYTGNVRDENWNRSSYRCLVKGRDNYISNDMEAIILVILNDSNVHFRDPKAWKKEGTYNAIIGAQRNNHTGCVLLYLSSDLYDWGDYGGHESVFPLQLWFGLLRLLYVLASAVFLILFLFT